MSHVVETWAGCYDLTWHGAIVPEAFAHPAKMSRALLRRILAELKAGGLRAGATIVDPFGGIGSTAIEGAYHGFRVVCCELEPKFVDLARQNVELHAVALEVLGRPIPTIVQGDSRRLRAHVGPVLAEALVSSPPYAAIASGSGGLNTQPLRADGQQAGRSSTSASQDTDNRYGTTDGQLARLPVGDVDAIVASPPYSSETGQGSGNMKTGQFNPEKATERSHSTRLGPSCHGDGYGSSPGQLGAMPPGERGVDAIVCSPPYATGGTASAQSIVERTDASAAWVKGHTGSACNQGYGTTDGQLAEMKPGAVDAVVGSPPYQKGADGKLSADKFKNPEAFAARMSAERSPGSGRHGCSAEAFAAQMKRDAGATYGTADGQMGEMKPGAVADAIVGSPPFEDSISAAMSREGTKMVRQNLPPAADVAAYLRERRKAKGLTCGEIDALLGTTTLYSWYEGRPAGTEIPTPERWLRLKEILDLDDRFDARIGEVSEVEKTGDRTTASTGHAKMDDYGTSDGQIGIESGATFWSAARDVVAECYAILRPGGYAAWVVKAFVKDGKIVDFPDDWRRLCEAVGFETLVEARASLVKESTYETLFGDVETVRKERKSFFRRIAEAKGSPRIDFETVWIMRRPA